MSELHLVIGQHGMTGKSDAARRWADGDSNTAIVHEGDWTAVQHFLKIGMDVAYVITLPIGTTVTSEVVNHR